jgi:hypothetical protein
MKLPLLRLVGAGVLAVLAAGLIWAGCRKSADCASEPEAVAAFLSAQQAPDDANFEVLRWSIATREGIADEVIAGRLTLLEAAAGFRAVDQVKERSFRLVESAMPGKTAEEQLCRRVLAFVAGRLERSGQRDPIVGRLEDELQEHLRHGALTLPEFRRPQNIPWFDQ